MSSNSNQTHHEILILSKENESNANFSDVFKMIIDMALETENKTLDPEIIKKSLNVLINNKQFGYYAVALEENNTDVASYKGMNQMTYEYNILSNKISFWLQSVMVKKEHRKKGVFKSLVKFSEELVIKDKENNKSVLKLYVDGDNKNAQKVYFNLGFTTINELFYERDFVFEKVNWEEVTQKYNNSTDDCLEIIDLSDIEMFNKFKLNEITFKDFVNAEEYSTSKNLFIYFRQF